MEQQLKEVEQKNKTGLTMELKRKLSLSAETEQSAETKSSRINKKSELMEVDDDQEKFQLQVEIPTNK